MLLLGDRVKIMNDSLTIAKNEEVVSPREAVGALRLRPAVATYSLHGFTNQSKRETLES